MSQGWERPDDVESHETYRQFPVEPGDDAPRTRSSEPTRRHEDPHHTEVQTPYSGLERPVSEPRATPRSAPGSSPSSGTGGSFVERGTVVVEPGQVVFRKYQVLERLGRGGMGEVWLVRDTELEVKRALKMITQGSGFDTSVRARFKAEAKAMARLSHPNIVGVIDAKLDQQDVAYIVMEYVPGKSLEKILKPGLPMSVEWTGRLLAQLCDALQEAHDQGIVHRDLKPSNLILVEGSSRRDQLKVFDFGIAKILHAEDIPAENRTVAGAFMGTPPYASPEQADGRAVPASDIYSVGVMLYEFLTGRRPFTGKSGSLIASTMYSAPPSFAEINPEANVPAELEAVVMRCLAKKPEDRPQTPAELLEEFRAATTSILRVTPPPIPIPTGSDPEPVPDPSLDVVAPPVPPPPPRRGPGPRPRPRWMVAAVALATAAAIVAVALAVMLRKPSGTNLPPKQTWNDRSFSLWEGRVYLPEGYSPGDKKDADGWPKTLIRNAGGVTFIRMKADTFAMGTQPGEPADRESSRPRHYVTLPVFYIQETEVTNAEVFNYLEQLATRPPRTDDWQRNYDELVNSVGKDSADQCPATGLRWDFAARFAKHHQAFLPSEAEWEFAARSGSFNRLLIWDVEIDAQQDTPNLAHIAKGSEAGGNQPATVKYYGKDRTPEGIFDLAGNVREWCRDPWRPYTSASVDVPTELVDLEPSATAEMVVRGGSFLTDPETRFTTYREAKGVKISAAPPRDIGFRLVIEIPPMPGQAPASAN